MDEARARIRSNRLRFIVAIIIPNRLVYLCTPHTATQATVYALRNIKEAIVTERHHCTMTELRSFPKGQLLTGGEVITSTVRNPYDIMVTQWLRNRQKRGNCDLSTFIREWDEFPYFHGGKLFYLAEESDRTLRYENLQAELWELLKGLGLPPISLEKQNFTEHKRPWVEYYDQPTLNAINDRLGIEIVRYGYNMITTPP